MRLAAKAEKPEFLEALLPKSFPKIVIKEGFLKCMNPQRDRSVF
jgi:hypothetical protein